MLLLRLTCILFISLLLSPAQEGVDIPTPHSELIAGPWEVASAVTSPQLVSIRRRLFRIMLAHPFCREHKANNPGKH